MPASFSCTLGDLARYEDNTIVGHLAQKQTDFTRGSGKSIRAWQEELTILRSTAARLAQSVPESQHWTLVLDYEIPLRNRRPDAVLIAADLVFVLEFKIGESHYRSADLWQVRDYALDLKDFHAASRNARIVPILVASAAPDVETQGFFAWPTDSAVAPEQRANARTLAEVIRFYFDSCGHSPRQRIDPCAWMAANYRPTPGIIQAAEMLFREQTVADISHHDATNLSTTTDAIVEAMITSHRESQRTICFVTGVPGAGKTLTGLNAVHDPRVRAEGRPTAMFLSGNGPLVQIITEAITRDRQKAGMSRQDARRKVGAFIANIHTFLTQHCIHYPHSVPEQHAIVFDEAQRAWSAEAVAKKHDLHQSEPELLLEVMARAPRWCTIVALIGGGQEINQGEAGLEEWGRALNRQQQPWRVMIAPHLVAASDESLAGHRLLSESAGAHLQIVPQRSLHLSVSLRSQRARLIGEWVNALLGNKVTRQDILTPEFPLVMTRDLGAAKRWLQRRLDCDQQGTIPQRPGILASSGGLRLRAEGLEVSSGFRQGFTYTDWFLNNARDLRSAALEVAATEFECQGLELDWTCVCWAGDFVIDPVSGKWRYRQLKGSNWHNVKRTETQQFIQNKYRVLLTRARKGMILWVPTGCATDPTREPEPLNATAQYLHQAGLPWLVE